LSKGKSRQVIDACIAVVLALWESEQQAKPAPEPFAIYV